MHTSEPIFTANDADAPRPDLPFIERDAITAIVYNPKNETYLGIRWKAVNWETFITGGIEEGQTAEEAARVEVREESGYKNLRLVKVLPSYHSKFFHKPKGVNRFAHFQSFLFELINDEQITVSIDEAKKHECVWLTKNELLNFRLPEGHKFLLNYIF
jgi:ADP-ribose pyrophosphatase YjhB (NUDIX family)